MDDGRKCRAILSHCRELLTEQALRDFRDFDPKTIMRVSAVLENSPCVAAGVKWGDEIVRVNNLNIKTCFRTNGGNHRAVRQ